MPGLEFLTQIVQAIPGGAWVVGLTGAVLVVQVRALFVARRVAGSRRALVWQVAAAVGVVAATAADVLAVRAGRIAMFAAFDGLDPSQKAVAISDGISGQLNGLALLASSAIWMWALSLVGLKQVLDARGSAKGSGSLAPLLLIPIGLTPVVLGALQWTTSLVHEFAGLAGTAPEEKPVRLLRALDAAAPMLGQFTQISRWAIVGLTVLAVGLIVARLRRTASAAPSTMPVPGRTAAGLTSALALLLAGALWVAARPLRLENRTPWPPPRLGGEMLMVLFPPTPDLHGSDALERAPVLQVGVDQVRIDDARYPVQEIGGLLSTLRMNYQLLHPGERFRGQLVVVADRALSMRRLAKVLRAAYRQDYDAPMFAFTREETIARPVMGPLRRVVSSSARASLVDSYDREAAGGADPDADATVLHAADFPGYVEFARRLVELRRAGTKVVLDLGKDPDDEPN